ncbi:MAG: 3'-5' exonuclease, partial [Anaerolineae bacterium]
EAMAAGTPPPGAPEPDTRSRRALVGFRDAMAEVMAARDRLPLGEFLSLLLARTSYAGWLRDGSDEGEDRWANVGELRGVAEEYATLPPEEALTAMLEAAALVADVDDLEEAPDRVTLLTLHSAKGLEFSWVFLVGLEEGLLPHSRSVDDPTALDEERRLFYVGLTRAKERVVIVHAFRRSAFGSGSVRQPSRFLADLPAAVVTAAGSTAANRGRPRHSRQAEWAPKAAAPAAGFRPGDKVRHGTFGVGTVVTCAPLEGDQEVTVAFDGAGLKKLLASFARLEPA